MYPVSANFLTAIKSEVRHPHWSGSINTATPITLDDDSFLSGRIQKTISSKKLEIGTVYSSQITSELKLSSVSRYELYGKVITASMSVDGASDVIPMGSFTITEATQTADCIKIKGYDNMVKFEDVNFNKSLNINIQTPYAWLVQMCTACGVTLGNTPSQINAMPNGNRPTGFADCVTDAKTWRDVLSYLCEYLGSYAYIGRDGKLYLGQYKSSYDDTINASSRFSSGLSDFITTYDGLYAIYKNGGVQEYVSNQNTGGLVLDLGTNPFLQFANDTNRQYALQEIIDAWNGIYYVPFDSQIPLMPHYDVGDVLRFTEKQASTHDIGVITDIVYDIKADTIKVKCAGDNPKLANAQDRFTKSIEGMSSEYSNGMETGSKSFWLLESHIIANNNIGGTKTLVAQIDFNQKTDVQRMGFMFDCDGTLSASAVVTIEITVDDELAYTQEYTDRKLKGKRDFPANTGFRVTGKGSHTAKVYMTVTDSPLLWSELS